MLNQMRAAGCFGSFKDSDIQGKINVIDLPLTYICHQVNIFNGVAEVQISQTYLNNSEKYLEIEYKLPIVPNACLHKFVAIFEKVRMEGVVKEKQIAKVEYQEAVKVGKKAAYGDIDSESKDILTLKIGNIAPKEQVKIQIYYAEQLSLNLNTFYQFNLLTKNLPKFINKVGSENYIEAFRKPFKAIEENFQWDFRLRLKSSRKIKSFKSISHSLIVEKQNDQSTDISLTFQKGEPFSKDFIFIYTTEDFELPSYTLGRADLGSSVMVSFIPKFCPLDVKDAELAAIKAQSFQTDMDAVRGQYIFLLDRSGSMGGKPIQKAKEALILFLKSLPIDTYFQVVSFGSGSEKIFQQSQKNSNQSISEAVGKINSMGANLGGTQIEKPLSDIFKSKVIDGYPRQIFLLTDGEVSNTQRVIDLIRKNTKYSRVHTIGFGNDVSHQLIIESAKKGKGKHIFIGNNENPSQKIIQLLNDSLTPVISKVSLLYDKDIVESIVPNPERLPYILKGENANFYISFKGHLSSPTSISLGYTDSLNNLPFKAEVQISPESQSEVFVDKLANYRRIKALEDAEEDGNIQDHLYYVKTIDKKQQIIDLSTKNQIISKYTAFICVQKELVDGKFEQIQGKGKEKIQIVQYNQPVPVKREKVFHKFFSSPSNWSYTAPPPPSIPQPPAQLYNPQMSFANFFGSSSSGPVNQNAPSMPQPIISKPVDMEKKKTFNKLFGLDGGGSSSSSTFKSISSPPPPPIEQELIVPSLPSKPINSQLYTNFFAPPPLSNNALSNNFMPPPPPPPSLSTFMSIPPPPSLNIPLPYMMKSIPPPEEKCIKKSLNQPQPKSMIQLVLDSQQFQGKWSDLKLIEKIYGANLAKQIDGLQQKSVAITILIVRWFSKNFPSKQYSLILKKAKNWLKKQTKCSQYSQVYNKQT